MVRMADQDGDGLISHEEFATVIALGSSTRSELTHHHCLQMIELCDHVESTPKSTVGK